MGVSFRDLRERCQLPVRSGNDVAGLLFGDWASLPLTKLWVDRGISPDVATVGMLVAGLAGAALQLPGGGLAVAGAVLLVLYYVLDCVDGEVARWHRVENIKWAYYEYVFHMLVKPLAFLGVGGGLLLETGRPAYLLLAAIAAVATLWLKIWVELPGMMFVKGVLAAPPGKDRAWRRFAEEVGLLAASREAGGSAAADEAGGAESTRPAGFPLGFNLVTLRALLTNFDVGLLLLLAATAADRGGAAGPSLPLLGEATWRGAWMAWYGLVLPLDFADYLRSFLKRGHFPGEIARLLRLAHKFEVPEAPGRAP